MGRARRLELDRSIQLELGIGALVDEEIDLELQIHYGILQFRNLPFEFWLPLLDGVLLGEEMADGGLHLLDLQVGLIRLEVGVIHLPPQLLQLGQYHYDVSHSRHGSSTGLKSSEVRVAWLQDEQGDRIVGSDYQLSRTRYKSTSHSGV